MSVSIARTSAKHMEGALIVEELYLGASFLFLVSVTHVMSGCEMQGQPINWSCPLPLTFSFLTIHKNS